ncbi:MAG: hypothetical protein NW217_12800 [Hyphomicrobiaceae bacterium]|nr:hypothetical protein [Hyphomicrobiaceae bacterium]
MADDGHRPRGAETGEFLLEARAAFTRHLFQPMVQAAGVAPSEVRRLVADIRDKLDALDVVIDAILPPTDVPQAPRGASHGSAASALLALTASASGTSGQASLDDDPGDPYDDIGRNQRARLRELTLLEFLARENRPFALQQILAALAAKGFEDTSGAVVSQLHRLKKLGVIDQPAGGMYEITDDGLAHLRRTRSSFGALIASERG